MNASNPLHAIVIGGGIGGLTAGIALQQRGIRATVYEQADEIRPLGAGLSLWTNAMAVLHQLGIGPQVQEAGTVLERLESRDWQGTVMAVTEVGAVARRYQMPNILIHRGDLQRILMAALETSADTCGSDESFVLNARCVRITQENSQVTAHFADGRAVSADFLVGADGIRSTVRTALFGDTPPRYAGYTAWLGVAPVDPSLPAGTAFEAWGRGVRFGLFRLPDQRAYWYALKNAPAPGLGARPGIPSEVLAFVSDGDPLYTRIVQATPASSVIRIGIYDRDPQPVWGQGRVTLVGDAAHPMTPNLGQGACQAIEDAVFLARCVGAAGSASTTLPDALQTYARQRYGRVAKIVVNARRFGRLAHLEHPLACWLRDAYVRATPDWFNEKWFAQFITPVV